MKFFVVCLVVKVRQELSQVEVLVLPVVVASSIVVGIRGSISGSAIQWPQVICNPIQPDITEV